LVGSAVEAGVSFPPLFSLLRASDKSKTSAPTFLTTLTQSQALGGSSEPSTFTTTGKQQHNQGEAEIKAAEAKGYVEGTADRIEGKKGESRGWFDRARFLTAHTKGICRV
jgi:hypothetical protein